MSYNAAGPIVTPTYDGSGQAIHPDVIDMVQKTGAPWHGWRYWMAMTPYPAGNDNKENPSVLVSNDRTTWAVPDGLTNPIDPEPGAPAYNSDTDIEWDADNNRMLVYWRHYTGRSGQANNLTFCYSESTDGTTWTPQADMFSVTYPDAAVAQLSPAVVRVGPGDWRMWCVGNSGPSQMFTAPTGTGPWSEGTNLRFNGVTFDTLIDSFWHWGIIEYDGLYYGLVSTRRPSFDYIYAMTSPDGINWTVKPDAVLTARPGQWDARLYRPTLVIEGDDVHVWYSANNAGYAWYTGYTQIPLTEWSKSHTGPPPVEDTGLWYTNGESASLYDTAGAPVTAV